MKFSAVNIIDISENGTITAFIYLKYLHRTKCEVVLAGIVTELKYNLCVLGHDQAFILNLLTLHFSDVSLDLHYPDHLLKIWASEASCRCDDVSATYVNRIRPNLTEKRRRNVSVTIHRR